jgi:WD40 repeat protein
VQLWDASTLEGIRTYPQVKNGVTTLAFSQDSLLLAAGAYDGSVVVWSADTGVPKRTLRGHKGPVYAVAFSPDGALLLTGGEDRTVMLWDLQSGKGTKLASHGGSVLAVAFSPDGRQAASAGADGVIAISDPITGVTLQAMDSLNAGAIAQVLYASNGKLLIAGDLMGVVQYFDVAAGKSVRNRSVHLGQLYALSLGPNNKLIATGGVDKEVKLWKF